MNVPHFTVIYDANILYGAFLRDVFMWLAKSDLYRARWTEEIHEEWSRNLIEQRPDMRQQVPRIRALMDKAVPDCLVTGYQGLIESIVLPDPDDRHVVAAAIRARAEIIVTSNLKHFPAEALEEYGIEAQHPDTFVCDLLDLDQAKVMAELEQHRAGMNRPPMSTAEYCDRLQKCDLPSAAALLRRIWNC